MMRSLEKFEWQQQNKFVISSSSKRSLIANIGTTTLIIGLILTANLCWIPKVLAQEMGMSTAASIGDRKIVSHFDIVPKIVRVGQNVLMKIFLADQNTNQKIIHVTVRMDISKDGKHVLGEFFHSHDGVINISVRQASSGVTSPATYTIGATMDDLTNAWIADPDSPIFVNGNIFSHPGTYKIILGVTTIDNDKTDLAQPLTYEYNIQVSP
jgi:hypothetical protein